MLDTAMRHEQGSPEWFAERAGCFTGSKLEAVVEPEKKGGEKLKAWHDIIWRIVVERLTGVYDEAPDYAATKWGKEVEPYAREAYEKATGAFVDQVGFIRHPRYPFVGCSPDGLVDSDGGLEMKAPKNSVIHLRRFDNGMPPEYFPQVQCGMWVTDRAWWDFVSYDPRMPEGLRLLKLRIKRDEDYITNMETRVLEAEAEASRLVEKFLKRAKYG